jgi:flagellar hook-basal body complex protein FliE
MIPPIVPVTSISGAAPAAATSAIGGGASSGEFSNVLGSALDELSQSTGSAETLALQGATGQASIADVTIAANEAQLAVQLAATVRDDGVAAMNSMMSMQAG